MFTPTQYTKSFSTSGIIDTTFPRHITKNNTISGVATYAISNSDEDSLLYFSSSVPHLSLEREFEKVLD